MHAQIWKEGGASERCAGRKTVSEVSAHPQALVPRGASASRDSRAQGTMHRGAGASSRSSGCWAGWENAGQFVTGDKELVGWMSCSTHDVSKGLSPGGSIF